MIPPIANGFLETLIALASGYVLYSAPLSRFWWPRDSGSVLYFRIGAIGITLAFACYAALYAIEQFYCLPPGLATRHALPITFPFAMFLWIVGKIIVSRRGARNPNWKNKLNLISLNEKGLDQFVYERIIQKEMIMVTLKNNKVYAGWPIQAPNNEDNQWLRIVPQWSGHRDKKSSVIMDTDYSKVMANQPSKRVHTLISVGEIVTVHPFDDKVFEAFNTEK